MKDTKVSATQFQATWECIAVINTPRSKCSRETATADSYFQGLPDTIHFPNTHPTTHTRTLTLPGTPMCAAFENRSSARKRAQSLLYSPSLSFFRVQHEIPQTYKQE